MTGDIWLPTVTARGSAAPKPVTDAQIMRAVPPTPAATEQLMPVNDPYTTRDASCRALMIPALATVVTGPKFLPFTLMVVAVAVGIVPPPTTTLVTTGARYDTDT